MDNEGFSVNQTSYVITAVDNAENSNEIDKSELKLKIQDKLNELKRK